MIDFATLRVLTDIQAHRAEVDRILAGPSPAPSVARFDERVESMKKHPSATEPCKVIPLFGGDIDA